MVIKYVFIIDTKTSNIHMNERLHCHINQRMLERCDQMEDNVLTTKVLSWASWAKMELHLWPGTWLVSE
jgi:hypothetical protein